MRQKCVTVASQLRHSCVTVASCSFQVRPNSVGSHHSRESVKPRFHALADFRAEHNIPGPQHLLRIAEMYTTAAAANQQAAAAREDSQDRDGGETRKFTCSSDHLFNCPTVQLTLSPETTQSLKLRNIGLGRIGRSQSGCWPGPKS